MSPRLLALTASIRSSGPVLRRALLSPYVVGSELPHLSGSSFHPISFGSDELDGYRSELIASLSGFRRRLWINRSLVLLLRALLLGAALTLGATIAEQAGLASFQWLLANLGIVAVVGGLVLIIWQRLSYFDVARVVDRQLGLKAQLGTAIEITRGNQPSPISRSQVRQATTIARRLEPSQAVAFRAPWRDLRLLVAVVTCTALVTFLGQIGLRVPVPDAASAMVIVEDPAPDTWYEVDPEVAADLAREAQSPTGLQALVQELRQQLDKNEITPQEYAAQVAAIEDQIRQQAEESARQQAALNSLADALSDSSATRSVAENLYRGAYAEAVQELADISQNTDRLSAQAQQELADRLSEAASRAAGSNSELASAAERAAEALRRGDGGGAQEALRDLASAMAEASQSVAPQSDLGQALQDLQEAQGLSDQMALGSSGDPQEGAPGTQGGSEGGGQEQGSGQQGGGRTTGPEGENSERGGGAGSGRGERIVPYGPGAQSTKPEITGNVLKITGKASNSGATIRADGSGPVPLTNPGAGTASVQGSGGARSTDPVTAIGENNYVPLEMKPVVKDYFSGVER